MPILLFATEGVPVTTSETISAVWPAVGMAAIAMAGTIVNSVMGYLKSRDDSSNNTKMALLEDAQRRCLEDHKECKEETKTLKEDHAVSVKDRAILHGRITELETRLTTCLIPKPG